MQELDYSLNMACCDGMAITGDGMAMGYTLRRAHLIKPWRPTAEAPAVSGSLFGERVPIPVAPIRKQLQQFGAPARNKRGLPSENFQHLVEQLQAHGLPYVASLCEAAVEQQQQQQQQQDEKCQPPEQLAECFFALGSNAPAS
jgi:hypothetical protein